MKQWTSNNTLCCHWCGTPLQSASLVTYLNGNLPCCGLCLTKTSDAKAIEEERDKANEIAVGYQLTADDLSKRLHETEEERDALRAELARKTALYEKVTDDFAGEVGSLRAELAAKDAEIERLERDVAILEGVRSGLRTDIAALTADLARARRALEKIANPIESLRKNLKEGEVLNGPMAIALTTTPSYAKEIAQAALKEGK